MQASRLANGRLHLNDGPIDLIIACDGDPEHVATAQTAAQLRFENILDQLCSELPLLRRPTSEKPNGKVARRMWNATRLFADDYFITPMAAVAGSVAEEILDFMVAAAPLARAMVNNGGDIAFYLAEGQIYRAALMNKPDQVHVFATSEISFSDSVRGVATSGWRGRSFSLGIADAVTVLATNASTADAAATLIANAVDLPGHPSITRQKAIELQPDSDLGTTLVTTHVAHLSPSEISAALAHGVRRAKHFLNQGFISSCALHLFGQTHTVYASTLQPIRKLAYA